MIPRFNNSTFKYFVLGSMVLVILSLLTVFLLRDPITLMVLERRSQPILDRIGLSATFESARLLSLTELEVAGVKLVAQDEPVVAVDRVRIKVPKASLSAAEWRQGQIDIGQLTAFFDSKGNAQAMLAEMRRRIELLTPTKSPKANTGKLKQRRYLPTISIEKFHLVDPSDWLKFELHDVRLVKEQLHAQVSFISPIEGDCSVSGTLLVLNLSCGEPIRLNEPRLGHLTLSAIEVHRKPTLKLVLNDVGIELAEHLPSPLRSVLGGVRANLTAGAPDAVTSAVPLALSFILPGGGRVDGTGSLGPLGGSLKASVNDLEFADPDERARGRLSGRYELNISTIERQLVLTGDGTIEDFSVQHPALAETLIGPFDTRAGGRVELEKNADGWSLKVSEGALQVGDIKIENSMEFVRSQGDWRLNFDAKMPTLSFEAFRASIPRQLLPNVGNIEGRGELHASMVLDLDSTDYDATKLDIQIDTNRLKLTKMPPSLPFDALRHQFQTRFEIENEDGEEPTVFTRMVGPSDERFVSLEDMTPILPLAAMAQEDGGFRRHKGISLFHLRGSLVDNLKQGRFFRGGSTITMQLARNLFLNRRKTLSRKLEEIVVAWLLEQRFDKDEIMTLYLNAVEFGPNIFGVYEGAQHYFGLHPMALSPPQAVWLVRLLPGPRLYYSQFEKKKLRKSFAESINWLMRHMVRTEMMSEDQYAPITQTSLFEVKEPADDVRVGDGEMPD